MKILITGATGLIGSRLSQKLEKRGEELLLATRSTDGKPGRIHWTAEEGFDDADLEQLEGLDAVFHLAGEPVSGRWTDEKKRRIRDSRVLGTRSIVDTLSRLKAKPKVLISASATGFYGDRGDDVMTESSAAGDTFLAKTCQEWEAEARRAEDIGIRTVLVRTGIVLTKEGGALAQMITPFKFGVGGVIGSGRQWMSWIALEDQLAIYLKALDDEYMRGAVNAVSPNPATNEEFTKKLGEILYRPTFLPLPAFAVNLVFGEMGDALLIDSTRVIPKRLEEKGFDFAFPDLDSALREAVR